MKNQSGKYHLFSTFMAMLVAVSISLPLDSLANHCDMDAQHSSKSEMAGEHCPHMDAHSSSHDKHDHQSDNDCNGTLSCACDVNQQQITAEAIPTITKTGKIFVVSVIRYIDLVPPDSPTFFTNIEFSSHTELPPLFLLNSVFLN